MGSILLSGRGLRRETKLSMQELELKCKGGLCVKGGGVIAGFYNNTKIQEEQPLAKLFNNKFVGSDLL